MQIRPPHLIYGALCALPISPVVSGIGFIAAAVLLKRPMKPHGVWWGLLIATLFSILCAMNPLVSLPGLLVIFSYMLIDGTIRELHKEPGFRKRLAACIFYPAVISALLGILGVLLQVRYHTQLGPIMVSLGTPDGRANSIFYHPNILAGYLLLALGVGFTLLEEAKHRIGIGLGLGAIGICLVMTQSRSAWIGGALALFLMSFGLRWRIRLGILGTTGVSFALFYQKIGERLSTLGNLGFISNADRLLAWQSALKMIHDRPLFGFGPFSWNLAYPQYRDPRELEHLLHAHNMYLHIGVEYGLIALVLLLAVILIPMIYSLAQKKATWPLFCVLVGYLVINLFEFVFSEGRNFILFFTLLGMLENPMIDIKGFFRHARNGKVPAGEESVSA